MIATFARDDGSEEDVRITLVCGEAVVEPTAWQGPGWRSSIDRSGGRLLVEADAQDAVLESLDAGGWTWSVAP